MRMLALWLLLIAQAAVANPVDPDDLDLKITVERGAATPFVGEMILVTIEGTFHRAILRERLVQPDLAGFSWMQLGADTWFDELQDGLPVKVFRRRMALFPERAGQLEIGAFTHRLTLLGPHNKWVEFDLRSQPIAVDVAPAPVIDGWWLPVRRLKVADDWSNSPNQLGEGEGVLRTIRVEALGISPDLLPPMPELRSPSALIFPHPEKRLVELSPQGPIAIAFWRWTIMPKVPPSAIIEPIELDFFDTVARAPRTVTISPQRVALRAADLPPPAPAIRAGRDRAGIALAAAAMAFIIGVALAVRGRGLADRAALKRRLGMAGARRELGRAVRRGDARAVWRAATRLSRQRAQEPYTSREIATLERAIFGAGGGVPDLRAIRAALLAGLRR